MTADGPPTEPDRDDALRDEIARLRTEVAVLNRHRFIRVQNSITQQLVLQFARGLALGLGTVVGASVLVSFLVYLLSQIDFVPVLGEWAADIAEQIQREVQANPDGSLGRAAPESDPQGRE